MIKKTIMKIKKGLLSGTAIVILIIFFVFDNINQKFLSEIESDQEDQKDTYRRERNSRENDGYFHEPMAIKYGGPREPFLSQLLRIQKIYGVIRRKEDNKPVQGMMLRISKPDIKVLSDANGEFEFEIYNIIYDKFDIEVCDPAVNNNILQVKTVEFKPEKKRGFYDRGFFKDEATIEILL